MASLVTLTMNPAFDVDASVERVEPEHKLRCEDSRYSPGGGGINVARVAHRLGVDVLAVFPAGGGTGDAVASLLDDEGVPHSTVPIAGTTKPSVAVTERATGDQYRFTFPGPELAPDELDAVTGRFLEAAEGAACAVVSGSMPPGVPDGAVADLAKVVGDTGTAFIVDTVGAPLREALAAGVRIAKPNLRELCDLEGEDTSVEAALRIAQRIAVDTPTPALAVSAGSGGAYLVEAGKDTQHVPSPDVEVQSRVGAGDAMTAGIATGIVRGMDLAHAMRLGVACGAAAVMCTGSTLCSREDVERLWRKSTDEEI